MGVVNDSEEEVLDEDGADGGVEEEVEWHHGVEGQFFLRVEEEEG